MDNALFFKEEKNIIFVLAKGHITSKLCTNLRKIVYSEIENNKKINEIIFDLSNCDYMDSTFMGLLVGFNQKLKMIKGHYLQILNPGKECINLLKGLGVLKLLKIIQSNISLPDEMLNISEENVSNELILEAHEDLMSISDDNKKKFELLHKMLKDDIDKKA